MTASLHNTEIKDKPRRSKRMPWKKFSNLQTKSVENEESAVTHSPRELLGRTGKRIKERLASSASRQGTQPYSTPKKFSDIKGATTRKKSRIAFKHMWEFFRLTRPPPVLNGISTDNWPQFSPGVMLMDEIVDPPRSGRWPTPNEARAARSRVVIGVPDEKAMNMHKDLMRRAVAANFEASGDIDAVTYVFTEHDMYQAWRRTSLPNEGGAQRESIRSRNMLLQSPGPSAAMDRINNSPSNIYVGDDEW